MILSKIFEKTAKKFKTLDKLYGKSLILVDKPLIINTKPSEQCSIFKLSTSQNLIILDYNSVLNLSNNGVDKFFISNEFEFVSSDSNNPESKFITIDNLNAQEKIAFNFLTTDGIGNSAQSVVFFTFPQLQKYYEQTQEKEFSFSYPHDTEDFNRCMNVIELISFSDEQIQSLSNISKEWNMLIKNYDHIKDLINTKNYNEAYSSIKNCVSPQSKNKP